MCVPLSGCMQHGLVSDIINTVKQMARTAKSSEGTRKIWESGRGKAFQLHEASVILNPNPDKDCRKCACACLLCRDHGYRSSQQKLANQIHQKLKGWYYGWVDIILEHRACLTLENQSMNFIISADWRTWAYDQSDRYRKSFWKIVNIHDLKKKKLSGIWNSRSNNGFLHQATTSKHHVPKWKFNFSKIKGTKQIL